MHNEKFLSTFATKMLSKFKEHIEQNFPECFQKKILVAISGGIDSIVLTFLLKKLNINIILAHCNFQLRNEESAEDELFVKLFSEKLQIPLKTIRFETKKFSEQTKQNTQLAARKLRYDWFEEIAKTENCDFIATAHHADDNLETFFINLSRGSGIDGLIGIPPRNGKIIRPLLAFSRSEIENFATENNLTWREDSSNFSDNYTRNKIRHHIAPLLKLIHPKFKENLQKTQTFLKENQAFIQEEIQLLKSKYFKETNCYTEFQFEEISKHPQRQFIVYQLFKPYGFQNKTDLNHFFNSHTGKELISPTHRLIKNRNVWILVPKEEKNEFEYSISVENKKITQPIFLEFSENQPQIHLKNTISVDTKKIQFPLKIRKPKQGDFFFPKGMNGKKKLLSKFFKDEKYSSIEKENQWLLTDANQQIIWIIGKRADERFVGNSLFISLKN